MSKRQGKNNYFRKQETFRHTSLDSIRDRGQYIFLSSGYFPIPKMTGQLCTHPSDVRSMGAHKEPLLCYYFLSLPEDLSSLL